MSRYAWLVCESDKTMICLGKIIIDQATKTTYLIMYQARTILHMKC